MNRVTISGKHGLLAKYEEYGEGYELEFCIRQNWIERDLMHRDEKRRNVVKNYSRTRRIVVKKANDEDGRQKTGKLKLIGQRFRSDFQFMLDVLK